MILSLLILTFQPGLMSMIVRMNGCFVTQQKHIEMVIIEHIDVINAMRLLLMRVSL